MQFHYNYTHDVMSMSLIIIPLLKFDTRHYEFFSTNTTTKTGCNLLA
jgi:hypothetical protein